MGNAAAVLAMITVYDKHVCLVMLTSLNVADSSAQAESLTMSQIHR